MRVWQNISLQKITSIPTELTLYTMKIFARIAKNSFSCQYGKHQNFLMNPCLSSSINTIVTTAGSCSVCQTWSMSALLAQRIIFQQILRPVFRVPNHHFIIENIVNWPQQIAYPKVRSVTKHCWYLWGLFVGFSVLGWGFFKLLNCCS